MEKERAPFRAGDVVEHGPSGEIWLLVCDEEDSQVRPGGWPETVADAADCTLVDATDDAERLAVLRRAAQSRDGRGAIAARQLAAEESETFSEEYVRFCAGLGYGRSTVAVLAKEVLSLRARVAELEAERDSAHDCIVEMQTTIARLGQSADMACEEPCGSCAGCLYAADVMGEEGEE